MKLPIRRTIIVNGIEWDFGRAISDAALIGDTVVLTFIPDEGEPSIMALDLDRKVLWRDMDLAHFAHDDDHLVMYSIVREEPLSFYLDVGYIARVDLKTGALLEMEFVK
ncbi:hypothetical protein [Lysobacter enzymogenes]|uniref:hypothetical protein n=1 Tax=Lysobacter enzymogenes TaxID=69 RepID=UPI00089BB4BA|nr:hypothetical protein [Lysobacter enzymogenes]SDW30957.1 hypothetical protein SAMN05421681_101673 [Lysobacter enzymogenes]